MKTPAYRWKGFALSPGLVLLTLTFSSQAFSQTRSDPGYEGLPDPAFFGPLQASPAPTVQQALPPQPAQPDSARFRWGAQLASSSVLEPHSIYLVFSPRLELGYQITDRWDVMGHLGLAYMIDNQGAGKSMMLGSNPGIHLGHRATTQGIAWRISLGYVHSWLHVPLDASGRARATMVNQALAATGLWNAWEYSRDHRAIPLQGSFILPLTEDLPMTVDLAIAPMFGVREAKSSQEIWGQAGVQFSLRAGDRYRIIPRLQTVLLPSTSIDRFQSALALRVRHRSKIFVETLVNLDPPLGMYKGLKRWGFFLGKEMFP